MARTVMGKAQVFQHTAARRRLQKTSTRGKRGASFNTQPRGGGCFFQRFVIIVRIVVSTHSRAEAAACQFHREWDVVTVSTHSRAEAAATLHHVFYGQCTKFQHTAARRRLLNRLNSARQ